MQPKNVLIILRWKLGNFGHCGRFVSKYHKMFCVGTLVFGTLVVNSIAMCSNIKSTWKSCSTLLIQLKEGKAICFPEFLGILLPKLFWPTVRKNCSSDQEKLLKFEAEGRVFSIFEITRTIYSNGERSEQFSVTECFFNLCLEVSHI